MKRSDITDLAVCEAVAMHDKTQPMVATILQERYPAACEKLIYTAMARTDMRGYIDHGVSLRYSWLTEKGWELLNAHHPGEYDASFFCWWLNWLIRHGNRQY